MTVDTFRELLARRPFKPFRLVMSSGQTYDVRHPEMIKILKSSVLVFESNGDGSDLPDEWESVSLMLTESISHLETAAR